MSAGTLQDAVPGNWVDRTAPAFCRPYLKLSRADRPIGGWLLMWPCWWSAALAALAAGRALSNPWHLLLFAVGAFAMRGAGCTYNDIVDRDIDGMVERTRGRPLPSGQVGLAGAWVWMVVQALIGLAVLVQFNPFAAGVGGASLAVVALYPFAKRVTSWPQLVLGFAFSWGALMGWAATFGSLGWAPLLLYMGSIAWVIGYDTIYACQDIEDDAIVGVRSTARLFGAHVRAGVALFYALAVVVIGLSLVLADASLIAFGGLGLFLVHLVIQVVRLDPGNSARSLAVFKSNREAGAILFVALALEAAVRAWL